MLIKLVLTRRLTDNKTYASCSQKFVRANNFDFFAEDWETGNCNHFVTAIIQRSEVQILSLLPYK